MKQKLENGEQYFRMTNGKLLDNFSLKLYQRVIISTESHDEFVTNWNGPRCRLSRGVDDCDCVRFRSYFVISQSFQRILVKKFPKLRFKCCRFHRFLSASKRNAETPTSKNKMIPKRCLEPVWTVLSYCSTCEADRQLELKFECRCSAPLQHNVIKF